MVSVADENIIDVGAVGAAILQENPARTCRSCFAGDRGMVAGYPFVIGS